MLLGYVFPRLYYNIPIVWFVFAMKNIIHEAHFVTLIQLIIEQST